MIFSTPEQRVRPQASMAGRFGRWTARVAAGVAATACFGCYSATSAPVIVKTPAPVSAQPADDETANFRAWPRSAALYHSGATEAWPTRWYYAPNPDYIEPEDYVIEPVMMTVQTVTLPITLIPDYPFRKVVYCGDVLPASYTANPPLPPEPMVDPVNPDPDPLVAPPPPYLPLLPVVAEPEDQIPLRIKPVVVKPAGSSTLKPAGTVAPTTQPMKK